LEGQANYVSCACVLPPNSTYPEGVILTGSNDHSIFAFSPVSGEVLYKLTGHTNAGKLSNLVYNT
jgi:phospholipase A-2-activating protein